MFLFLKLFKVWMLWMLWIANTNRIPLVKNKSWFLATCWQISLNQPPPLIYFMLEKHNKREGRIYFSNCFYLLLLML